MYMQCVCVCACMCVCVCVCVCVHERAHVCVNARTVCTDAVTSRNLELLENQRDAKSSHTLYGVLNYTHTPGGARLLRSNILQPSSGICLARLLNRPSDTQRVSQGLVSCCHTENDVAGPGCSLTQSQYTVTGLISPDTDPASGV